MTPTDEARVIALWSLGLTTAIYARLNLDPVRTALEANAQRMLRYAEGCS